MTSFNEYLSQGNAWLFIPAAVVLGMLHGLEPGHSKTMMAAFIIAIRGTVRQAALLGISTTISHTAIIWVLAFVGLRYAGQFNVNKTEPFSTGDRDHCDRAGGLDVLPNPQKQRPDGHHHEHGPHGGVMLDTGHGWVEVSVSETNVPSHFRLFFFDAKRQMLRSAGKQTVTIETARPDGGRQTLAFVSENDFLKSTTDIPEPHEFRLLLKLAHKIKDERINAGIKRTSIIVLQCMPFG